VKNDDIMGAERCVLSCGNGKVVINKEFLKNKTTKLCNREEIKKEDTTNDISEKQFHQEEIKKEDTANEQFHHFIAEEEGNDVLKLNADKKGEIISNVILKNLEDENLDDDDDIEGIVDRVLDIISLQVCGFLCTVCYFFFFLFFFFFLIDRLRMRLSF
jgi:hypothetical protein